MLFNIFLSLLSLSQNETNLTTVNEQILGDRGCGLGSEDIFFINSMDDINLVKDCSTINGSLFINGDYNIESLKELHNIEYITGYLVIYDSHMLKSLKGLENLKNIYALNPYLLEYGVTIKYNNNNEDNSTGLCFTDTVNWGSLTDRNIIVSNNREDCPTCHLECQGCFGPGRLLCQECVNFRSGIACVATCPEGTTISDLTCVEYIPNENILLNFSRLDYNERKLNLSWEIPYEPRGFILEYIILRDGVEVYRSFYDNDGYYSNDFLVTQFIDTLPELDRNYQYSIAYSNSEGSFESELQDFYMFNRIPHDITPFRIRGIQNTSVFFQWFYNHSSLTPIFEYNINGSGFIEIPSSETTVTIRSWNSSYVYLLQDLIPYTTYNVNIRARYISNEYIGDITPKSFKTLVGNPPQPSTPYLVNDVLFWNETSGVNGPILFYIIWMNQTEIYNGDYLEEGIDLIPFMENGFEYKFRVTAFTNWNLYSNSLYTQTYRYLLPLTTLQPVTTLQPTLPIDDLETWGLSLIILAIILAFISLIIIILGIYKYMIINRDDTPQTDIYNTGPIYRESQGSINVRKNNILVDEISIGRSITNPAYIPPTSRQGAIKNTYYGELESFLQEDNAEEIVMGFNDIGDSNSVEYLSIIDTETPKPVAKPRRRSTITRNTLDSQPTENITKTVELNNNLKKDTNYQNTAKRKMSLLEELKLKIPEMAPKNMMLD
jgi:hypothetical protein